MQQHWWDFCHAMLGSCKSLTKSDFKPSALDQGCQLGPCATPMDQGTRRPWPPWTVISIFQTCIWHQMWALFLHRKDQSRLKKAKVFRHFPSKRRSAQFSGKVQKSKRGSMRQASTSPPTANSNNLLTTKNQRSEFMRNSPRTQLQVCVCV